MKTKLSISTISFIVLLFMSSCITRQKLSYLQYPEATEDYIPPEGISVTPEAYEVLPYDHLYIRVVTPDPQWSAIFNPVPEAGGRVMTNESAALLGYQVDIDGYIEIPFVGSQQVAGKTLSEIKVKLDSVFGNYVTDAAITVKLVNNHVSVVGEVNDPGRYTLTKDRVNVFEAISMAGDLTIYSDRDRIHLVRPTPDGPIVMDFSLADRDILSSELYYIMPNDVIYAPPIKGRSIYINSSQYSIVLSSIATLLVIIGFFI